MRDRFRHNSGITNLPSFGEALRHEMEKKELGRDAKRRFLKKLRKKKIYDPVTYEEAKRFNKEHGLSPNEYKKAHPGIRGSKLPRRGGTKITLPTLKFMEGSDPE